MFDLQYPNKLKEVMMTIMALITADVIPTEDLYNFLFSFKESGDFNEQFADNGYAGSNFFQLMGSVTIFTIVALVAATFRYIVF